MAIKEELKEQINVRVKMPRQYQVLIYNDDFTPMDCVVKVLMQVFDKEEQGTQSGGSGCGCSATTLSAHFLPKTESGELKRILFVPTGAMLSQVSFNEGQNVPGTAHGVVIEHAGQP